MNSIKFTRDLKHISDATVDDLKQIIITDIGQKLDSLLKPYLEKQFAEISCHCMIEKTNKWFLGHMHMIADGKSFDAHIDTDTPDHDPKHTIDLLITKLKHQLTQAHKA